jgi:hypothetical protein
MNNDVIALREESGLSEETHSAKEFPMTECSSFFDRSENKIDKKFSFTLP